MKANENKKELIIQCDICGYNNLKQYVKYSGVCHCCGKILDDRAYFKQQMNKKMRLWRNKKILKTGR